jgi:hypothetical protein
MYYSAQLFSVEMDSCKLFCPSCPRTAMLPISASRVARIADMNHQHLGYFVFLMSEEQSGGIVTVGGT